MKHSRRIILQSLSLILLLSVTKVMKAQEMWGITMSNYAGSTGTILNPTAIYTSKLYLDVNIATADIFFDNNYGYIHKQDFSLFKYLGKNPQFPEYGPDDMPFDHYTDKNSKYIYSSELIRGPSAMVAVGRHAFALYTGARALTSGNAVPYEIANFGYYGLDYTPQHNIDFMRNDFGSSAIIMGEVGLTYAYGFRKMFMEDWSAGITVKRLFSVGGAYVQANNLNYMVLNDTTINIKNLNAEVGYALPFDYETNEFPGGGSFIKGGGFGFDIGVTFQNKSLSYQKKRIRRLCSQRYADYIYKVGISLIDFGFVDFKTNAQQHNFTDVSEYWINIDTLSYTNLNQLSHSLSDVFYGNPFASLTDEKIRIYLPTALSIQGDYRIWNHWYAGAAIIQPLRMGNSYLRRPAQIALVPRYESPHLEFSVPISLYDYKRPRIGASVRYYFFTIGTDNLLGSTGITDFTGLDFYFSIKINFRKGFCGKFKRNLPCENEEYGIRKKR